MKIEDFNEEFKKRLEEAETEEQVQEIFNQCKLVANEYTKFFKDTMHEEVMKSRIDEQEFLLRMESQWCDAFVASEAMYTLVLDSAERYVDYVSSLQEGERNEKIKVFTVIKYIHGRALQQYLEIITLMKNGFADGAYARWRSMYELSIIAKFIIENGEDVAEAYIESSNEDSGNEWARKSGKFDDNKKYITLNDIKKKCNLNIEVWREKYKLANKIIHSSAEGTFYRLGTMEDGNIVPVGRSNYGIDVPAEHSAITLAEITQMFYTIYPYGESIVAVNYIDEWLEVIREKYFKIHDEYFQDDTPLWESYCNSKLNNK